MALDKAAGVACTGRVAWRGMGCWFGVVGCAGFVVVWRGGVEKVLLLHQGPQRHGGVCCPPAVTFMRVSQHTGSRS